MIKKIVFLLLVVLLLAFTMNSTNTTNKQTTWTTNDSKAYAKDMLTKWRDKQWVCLSRLWGKESAWQSTAYNPIRVNGKNAGGIPQLLGLNPETPATQQIERGLDYIYYRYNTPCNAWRHFQKKGWH